MLRALRLLSHIPLGIPHPVGAAMGWLAFLASPGYRRRLWNQAGLAGLSVGQRLAAVGQAGKMVAEVPHLWCRPVDQRLERRVRWQGVELLDQAVAEGRGVMLLTPHLGCFEVTAQAYAERHGTQHPVTALYRPAKQAGLATLMTHARNRPGMRVSPATLTGVRQLMRALKQGDTIGVLPDQVPPEGMGEWAPFFGQPAYTMTMASKLAAQTGCALVLLRGERLGMVQRWRQRCDFIVHVSRLPPEQDAAVRQKDLSAATAAMNAVMQALILQCPHQYLWGYNRFKGPRPDILTSEG